MNQEKKNDGFDEYVNKGLGVGGLRGQRCQVFYTIRKLQ